MKKILVMLLVGIIFLPIITKAQFEDNFRDKSNLVIFSGLVDRQNSKNYGYYYGTYLDYRVFKSANDKWTLAPYIVLSRSDSRDFKPENSGVGVNANSDYGGGLSFGYYEPDFTFRHQIFIGSSLGLRYGTESQNMEMPVGIYSSKQSDLCLNFGLNVNLLKSFGLRPDLLPRSQLQFHLKLPVKSSKLAYWNNELVNTEAWNKTYFEALFKQSIYQFPLGYSMEWQVSPKLIALYSYSSGDKRSFYGLGTELSFRREYRDNFFSVFVLYKESYMFLDNYLIAGLNINLSALMKNK